MKEMKKGIKKGLEEAVDIITKSISRLDSKVSEKTALHIDRVKYRYALKELEKVRSKIVRIRNDLYNDE